MANIRVVPTSVVDTSIEEVAVINASSVVFPEESMWLEAAVGELTVVGHVPGRAGSWVSRLDISTNDTPPFTLSISDIDLHPSPRLNYPDVHWVRNGQDIIPRS